MGDYRVCAMCGKPFIQLGTARRPMKYCSDACRYEARRRGDRQKDARDKAKRRAARGMSKVETGKLDANLAEAKRRGMTYSEWQVEQTLRRVRRGEL